MKKIKDKLSNRGSILAFALIIMGIVLAGSLAIAMTTTIEQKNSSSSAKSTQAFQAAQSAAEIIVRDIKSNPSRTLSFYSGCTDPNGTINATSLANIANATATITVFKDSLGTRMLCSDQISLAYEVQSNGTFGRTTRAFVAPVPSRQTNILASQPLAYWKMDEDWNGTAGEVKNATGNIYHGQAMDGADTTTTSGNYKYGTRGGSFSPTAPGDYVVVPEFKFPGAFTLEFWIKYTPTGNPQMWASEVGGLATSGTKFGTVNVAGLNKVFVRVKSAGSSDQTVDMPSSGAWHQMVLVRRNDCRVYLYVDGFESPLFLGAPQCYDVGTEDTKFGRIGKGNSTTAANFNGFIDDVAIYDRALTPLEISYHFQN